MKLDDTHPDYFVDDGTDADATTRPAQEEAPRTISFADSTSADGARQPADTAQPAAPQRPARRRWKRFLWWTAAILIVVLGVAVYFRYFSPYIEDGRMKCYVINVEKRGMVFKTYEADVVSEQALTDTVRLYSRDISFSVPDERLARELQNVQGTGRMVTVTYETYNATVPWRGASKSVITGAQIAPPASN